MGLNLYLKSTEYARIVFDNVQRIEWEERPIEIVRYGKKRAASESWCVLFDAPTGGKEIARFKATEVRGYVYHRS